MNKHKPFMNPKRPAGTLRWRGSCLAQAMIQWCFSPLARIRCRLSLIRWSWGSGTISPATPERNDPQCKFLPVTSECLTATKRTTGGQDTCQFPSGVQHFKPHASSSPMVCAVSRSNMFSLRKVGTPRAVVPEKEELLVW